MEEQLLCLVRLQISHITGGIARFIKGLFCGLLNGNMVRVSVTANGIKGEHHLRFEQPDIMGYFCRYFFQRGCCQCLRMVVIFTTGHTRIAVTQIDHLFDAQ
ncbi:hypothetical protein SDC9_128933 [bioreactor metagenome]|uniref:Uncharacterized protein n=1 Tax=bioreactor metagenome TaxID=1076179 RepID=A0A645CXL4_9ZZZZ